MNMIKNLRTTSRKENVKLKIIEQDIFSLIPEHQNKFDYIIEQTCFCAIHPSRRQEYERLVKKLLKPDGLLIGLWFPLDKKLDEGYVWDEIHNFDLEKSIKKGKTKFGFIFNTDTHDKDGTHWIALYLDIYNKTQPYISYFDSNGIEIPREIKVLVDRIIDQAKSLNINLKFMQNHPLSHQNKDGECGIYTIYFITQLLQNIKPISYFNTVKIPDNIMSNFRKIFFNI